MKTQFCKCQLWLYGTEINRSFRFAAGSQLIQNIDLDQLIVICLVLTKKKKIKQKTFTVRLLVNNFCHSQFTAIDFFPSVERKMLFTNIKQVAKGGCGPGVECSTQNSKFVCSNLVRGNTLLRSAHSSTMHEYWVSRMQSTYVEIDVK